MSIENDFKYHPPKEGDVEKFETIRQKAGDFAKYIEENCPPSRERALAITNLEQAVFWANASVARYKPSN